MAGRGCVRRGSHRAGRPVRDHRGPGRKLPRRAHLWWLGGPATDALLPLRDRLGTALPQRDVPIEPAGWVPHVTVARGVDLAPPPMRLGTPVRWPVERFALIHSQSGKPDGYTVLRQWALTT